MAIVGFVRHGITDWNQELRIQGSTDIPLNEEGLRQAALAAERLRNEPFDLIYASDLKRAAQTAEAIGKAMNKPVLFDTRLREKLHGQLEGYSVPELIEKWGENWRELNAHEMETDESMRQRGLGFLEEIMTEHKGKSILLVSHGGILEIIMRRLLGDDIDIPADGLANTSVTYATNNEEKGKWEYSLLNCTAHLEAARK